MFYHLSIYSHQGQNHSGSYKYTLTTNDGDSYSFVSVDMCPKPGLGPPFNFLGSVTQVKKTIRFLCLFSNKFHLKI